MLEPAVRARGPLCFGSKGCEPQHTQLRPPSYALPSSWTTMFSNLDVSPPPNTRRSLSSSTASYFVLWKFSRNIEVSARPKRPQLPPSGSTVSGGHLVHGLLVVGCGQSRVLNLGVSSPTLAAPFPSSATSDFVLWPVTGPRNIEVTVSP
jgi:hypothetical protein